jgi:hypothetical protein
MSEEELTIEVAQADGIEIDYLNLSENCMDVVFNLIPQAPS